MLRNSQSWLVDRMKEFGYLSDSGGVCYGLSHAAKVLVALGKINELQDYLSLIQNIDTPFLLKKLVDDWQDLQYILTLNKSSPSGRDTLTIANKSMGLLAITFDPPLILKTVDELRQRLSELDEFFVAVDTYFQSSNEVYAHLLLSESSTHDETGKPHISYYQDYIVGNLA